MSIDRERMAIRGHAGEVTRQMGAGALRISMLFGSIAIALTLLMTPLLAERSQQMASRPFLDTMATGTVPASASARAPSADYILRRSVLNTDPHTACRLGVDGAQSGDC